MSGLTYFVSLSNLLNRLLLACLFASALAYSPGALEPEEVTVVKIFGLVLSLIYFKGNIEGLFWPINKILLSTWRCHRKEMRLHLTAHRRHQWTQKVVCGFHCPLVGKNWSCDALTSPLGCGIDRVMSPMPLWDGEDIKVWTIPSSTPASFSCLSWHRNFKSLDRFVKRCITFYCRRPIDLESKPNRYCK